MKITKTQAKKIGNVYKINFDNLNFDDWLFGLNVELEHGKKFGTITNITNDNFLLTGKIVIAHLLEFPDYYQRLKKMEDKADLFWKNKNKKSIFLDK